MSSLVSWAQIILEASDGPDVWPVACWPLACMAAVSVDGAMPAGAASDVGAAAVVAADSTALGLPAVAVQPASSSDARASDTIAGLRRFVALIILGVLSWCSLAAGPGRVPAVAEASDASATAGIHTGLD